MRVRREIQHEPYLKGEVEVRPSELLDPKDEMSEAALRNLRDSAEKLLDLLPDIPEEMKSAFGAIRSAHSAVITQPLQS